MSRAVRLAHLRVTDTCFYAKRTIPNSQEMPTFSVLS